MATAEAMADPNPFIDSLRFERRIPECTIVIFGANGDLAKRKLLPALYSLAHDRRLSAGFAVAGNSRTAMSDEDFRSRMKQSVKEFGDQDQYDEKFGRASSGDCITFPETSRTLPTTTR